MTDAGSRKSVDAYRTISEVAADLKLPQHVLRFWETRFAQVRPLKRAGGRRFYRPEDVDLLRAVKTLLYGDGYTIKGVQRILREQGPRAVAALAASPSRGAVRPTAASPPSAPVPQPEDAIAAPSAGVQPDPPLVAAERDGAPESAPIASQGPVGLAARLKIAIDEIEHCARLLADARSGQG